MSPSPRHPPAQLVGCVLAGDVETALRRAAAIGELCDLIEFRLDAMLGAMKAPDVESMVTRSPCPAIVTCRREVEGGLHTGPEDARLDLLRRAVAAGAAYVDLEPDAIGRLGDRGATKVIGSVHDPDGIPADLEARVRGLRDDGADIVKVAVAARDLRDVTRVLEFLAEESERGPVSAHAMGDVGRLSRLVAPRYGSVLVYAASAPGAEAAPGQASVHDHRRVLRTHRIGRSTRLYAVLGGDVSRSPSPAIMNAAFESLRLDRAYVPFSCSHATEALRSLPADLFDGMSVTIPHKETLGPILEETEDLARRAGAVNTMIRTDSGGYRGANTDAPGIRDALGTGGLEDLGGASAIVIGAGGAARAAVAALVSAGADVSIGARNAARATAVANSVGGQAVPEERLPWDRATVVVQTTPLGSRPSDPLPFDPDRVRGDAVVLDAVVVPPVTPVLRSLEGRGVRTVSGLEMFLSQAVRQVRLWTGRDAPADVLRAAATRHLDRLRPVVLVGLRGAGKSTIGPRLAERLGRAYLDTDDEVTRAAGRTPGEILREDGEARFREIEREVVRVALAGPPSVVALGGGAADDESTRCLLAETSRVIFLDAEDATLLARIGGDEGRPPLTDRSPAEEIAWLRARREPVFRALAAIRVETDPPADPASVTRRIERDLAGCDGI